MRTQRIDCKTTSRYGDNELFPQNHEFKVPLWSPEDGDNTNQILIMINGFLEGVEAGGRDPDRWLPRYESIAEEVAKKGISAVLLPLPFHFERSRDLMARGKTFIDQLRPNGVYLYDHGYRQVLDDLTGLVNKIKNEPGKYGLHKAPKIHLLGYSLGGAAALGASEQHGASLASITALFSGWGIANIDAETIAKTFGGRLNFGADQWAAAMAQLEHNRANFDKTFNALMWGDGNGEWLQQCPSRMLFIHGIVDEIFPPTLSNEANNGLHDYVRRLAQPGEGERRREIISIQLLEGHLAWTWKAKARRRVARYVADFIADSA